MPAPYLRAVKLFEGEGVVATTFAPMTWDVRVAFFRDLVDVSKRERLDAIAERHGVPIGDVTRLLENGRAHAELDNDVRLQRDFSRCRAADPNRSSIQVKLLSRTKREQVRARVFDK